MVVGAWALVHLGLVANGLATGGWPWQMFAHPPAHDRRVVLEVRAGDGPWTPLPLEDAFRWRRGFTTLGVLSDAPAMTGRGGWRERRALARWAVPRLDPGGRWTEARLWAEEISIRTGRVRTEDLGTFRLRADRAEAE